MIYLDNAATSWPKPECVHEATLHFLREVGANPGRSGHRLANAAERTRFATREAAARLFNVGDPLHVVFTLNATAALNLVMLGLLTPGTHATTTGIEHNAVMRPLRALEQRGVSLSIAGCDADGALDPARIESLLRPETRLIIVNHASNVCGTVLPVRQIGAIARQHGIPLLLDAAQTAGCWPIDIQTDNIDLLAFSGHKALLGPPGTGGLAIHPDFDIDRLPPLVHGGTGSRSEHEHQPDFLPDKFEPGTPNIVGLAGLRAGIEYVQQRGPLQIRAREARLTQRLIEGLGNIADLRVLGPHDPDRQTAVVSFTSRTRSVSGIAQALDERFEIMCRPGLHCAPAAHRTLGTLPDGSVRLSPGPFTTEDEIDRTVDAVRQLVGVESRG